jgi:hypothetical protein
MSISTAFFAFVAVLALADILGPGHQWGGLAAATAWFLFCRWLGPRGWNRLLAASLALSVTIAAMAVVQMWFMDRARGPFASPNYLGAYSVLMFWLAATAWTADTQSKRCEGHRPREDRLTEGFGPSGLFGRQCQGAAIVYLRRGSVRLAAIANLLSLALSQSRGALLALGAGLVVLILTNGKRQPYKLMAVAFTIGTAVLLIRPGNEEARWSIWWTGLHVVGGHPWLGWGQGGVGIPEYGGFYNVPLDVLIWGGIPALAAGAWLLIAAAKVALKEGRPYLAFLAAWFVQGLFLSGTPATWMLLIAVLAHLVRRGRARGDVAHRPRLIDHHHDLCAGRRRLEGERAKKLQLAVLGGREAHPAQDILVDLADDAGRIDRAIDRRRGGHHADRDRATENETDEAGTDRVAHDALQAPAPAQAGVDRL